jgi:predicted XRE-type DNA-binding protein
MTKHRSWKDVRAERIRTSADEARVAALKDELAMEVRAYRLAEVRKHQGLTQRDIAAALEVSQARISKMEHGDLQRTELSTIRRYVEALGGRIEIVASFGDQRVILT